MTTHLRVTGRTDAGNVRRNNEDAFLIADLNGGGSTANGAWSGRLDSEGRGVLLAVADGMGGHASGEVASGMVIESLATKLVDEVAHNSKPLPLQSAIENANRDVWDEACKRGIEMGTTLTAVHVQGGTAYVAEVGDSRAYVMRAGQITQLTRDQTCVRRLVESGVMDEAAAKSSPLKHVILQAMGIKPLISVETSELQLRRKDCLILCSDGVHGVISADEMRTLVLNAPTLDAACSTIIAQVKARGAPDNATVLLAGVGGELPEAMVGESVEATYRILQTFDQ